MFINRLGDKEKRDLKYKILKARLEIVESKYDTKLIL